MSFICPSCGATEFEKRGVQRIYAQLPVGSLEVDSWSGGDIEWDMNDGGEVIYCLECDEALVESDFIKASA